MRRSSLVTRAVGLALFLGGVSACAGRPPPPRPPESEPVVETDEPVAPPPARIEASAAAPVAEPEPASAPPPSLALPAAPARLKVKTTKALSLEIAPDGTVKSGGKAVAKIAGMELYDASGKPELKVAEDGTITTASGAPYARLEGDTLTTSTGAKWTIAEDGTFKATSEKGAEKAIGRAYELGSAKRAALLSVAFVTWGLKAPQPKAATRKKPAAK